MAEDKKQEAKPEPFADAMAKFCAEHPKVLTDFDKRVDAELARGKVKE